jgi:hypothetical protein
MVGSQKQVEKAIKQVIEDKQIYNEIRIEIKNNKIYILVLNRNL